MIHLDLKVLAVLFVFGIFNFWVFKYRRAKHSCGEDLWIRKNNKGTVLYCPKCNKEI